MTIPASGPLSIKTIADEFGKPYNLGALYGVAAGIPASGPISIGMFYGKSNVLQLNISNTVNPNINQMLTNAGWNGSAMVELLIGAGSLVNTLVIPTRSFPGGLRLTIGAGARLGGIGGGRGVPSGQAGSDGTVGGTALYTRTAITINNGGFISGGGQKGGAGAARWVTYGGGSTRYDSGWADGGNGQGFVGNSLTIANAESGQTGTYIEYPGAVLGGQTKPWARGGDGATGATWGNWSNNGGSGDVGGSYSDSGSSSLAPHPVEAAFAIDGNAYCTYEVLGTIQGKRS